MSASVSSRSSRRSTGDHHDDALAALRELIDGLDEDIVRMLNRRAELALRVGQVKKAQARRVYDPKREQQVLRRVRAANRGPLSRGAIEKIFREIVRQHRRLAQLVRPE